jgi:hypothetical protein
MRSALPTRHNGLLSAMAGMTFSSAGRSTAMKHSSRSLPVVTPEQAKAVWDQSEPLNECMDFRADSTRGRPAPSPMRSRPSSQAGRRHLVISEL